MYANVCVCVCVCLKLLVRITFFKPIVLVNLICAHTRTLTCTLTLTHTYIHTHTHSHTAYNTHTPPFAPMERAPKSQRQPFGELQYPLYGSPPPLLPCHHYFPHFGQAFVFFLPPLPLLYALPLLANVLGAEQRRHLVAYQVARNESCQMHLQRRCH